MSTSKKAKNTVTPALLDLLSKVEPGVSLVALSRAFLDTTPACKVGKTAFTKMLPRATHFLWSKDIELYLRCHPHSREFITWLVWRNFLSSHSFRYTNCTGWDLSGAFLHILDLYDSNFSNAKLTSTYFAKSNLHFAWFIGADLFNTDFTDANIMYCNFSGSKLFQTDFSNCIARNADFSNCTDGNGVNFLCADLQGACFFNANLKGSVNLERANLNGASYDSETQFPKCFNPEKAGMKLVGR